MNLIRRVDLMNEEIMQVLLESGISSMPPYEFWLFLRHVQKTFSCSPRRLHFWENLANVKESVSTDDWNVQLQNLLERHQLVPGYLFAEDPPFAVEVESIAQVRHILSNLPFFEYGIVGETFDIILMESDHGLFYVGSRISDDVVSLDEG